MNFAWPGPFAPLLAGLLAALGAGLLIFAGALFALDLAQRIGYYRQSRHTRTIVRYHEGKTILPPHVLYGYPDFPWDAAGICLTVAVLIAILLAARGWTPLAVSALGCLRLPHLLRRMLMKEGKARLQLRVRDFVDDLREAYALYGSLGRALAALVDSAQQAGRKDPLAIVLAHHASARTADLSADQILERMASDLHSEDMQNVAKQVRLALAGGRNLGEALAAVADNLSEQIQAAVTIKLQAAPNSYVLPIVICMFGPILVLVLYPLVLRVLSMLAFG